MAPAPCVTGRPERATFDYVRHGTTTLSAALEVATGKVTDACTDRHRDQKFLGFLRQVAAAYPAAARAGPGCERTRGVRLLPRGPGVGSPAGGACCGGTLLVLPRRMGRSQQQCEHRR